MLKQVRRSCREPAGLAGCCIYPPNPNHALPVLLPSTHIPIPPTPTPPKPHPNTLQAQAEGTVTYVSNMWDTYFEGGRDHRLDRLSITQLPYYDGA